MREGEPIARHPCRSGHPGGAPRASAASLDPSGTTGPGLSGSKAKERDVAWFRKHEHTNAKENA